MKSRIKEGILERKEKLSEHDIARRSKAVVENLEFLPEYKEAKTVLFYVSFKKESDTHELIKKLLESKEKNVLVPFVEEDDPILKFTKIASFEDLEPGMYGILEPKKELRKEYDGSIDIVLVPGNVFDKNGHRIGYGHGYYDRFLETMSKNTLKVGMAYQFQVVERIPEEPHDVPMDVVIAEKSIYRIKI